MGRFIEWFKNLFAGNQCSKSMITNATIVNSEINQVAGDQYNYNVESKDIDILAAKMADAICAKNYPLLNELIEEKLELCKKLIFCENISALEDNIKVLTDSSLKAINSSISLRIEFYNLLLKYYKDELLKETINNKNCLFLKTKSNIYATEIKLIEAFISSPYEIEYKELAEKSPETQAVVLSSLYKNEFFESIISLHDQFVISKGTETEYSKCSGGVGITYEFYYGLCKYNIGDFKAARKALKQTLEMASFADDSRRYMINIILLASDIGDILVSMAANCVNSELKGALENLYYEYADLLKNKPEGYKRILKNEAIFESIKLQCILVLSPENFLTEYKNIDSEIKNSLNAKLALANYYDIQKNYTSSKEIYYELPWEDDGQILKRLAYALVMMGDYDAIVELHHKCNQSAISSDFIGIYLTAIRELFKNDNGYSVRYYSELKAEIDKNSDTLENLFGILLSISNADDFEKYAIDVVRALKGNIKESTDILKAQYAGILLGFGYGFEANEFIYSINDYSCVNEEWAGEFFKDLYIFVARNVSSVATSHDNVSIAESIAEWFIEKHLCEIDYLKLITNKVYDQCRYNLALAYSERLFDALKRNALEYETVLFNIIGIIVNNKLKKPQRWNEYLDELKKADSSEALFTLAIAYDYEGDYSQAEFYIYKSLYILNGKEDTEFCMRVLSFLQSGIARHSNESDTVTVRESAVVTLRKIEKINQDESSNSTITKICLDGEFDEKDNISLGINHYGVSSPLYQKLKNCNKGEIVDLESCTYIIEKITDRFSALQTYLFERLVSHSEKCGADKSCFNPIYGIDIDDFKEQVVAFEHSAERIEAKEALLNRFDLYFADDSFINPGIPLDMIILGNYDDYLGVIYQLLYKKDYAFKAGHLMIDENTFAGNIVLSISSLVVLGCLDLLNLIEPLTDKLYVAESMMDFLRERIRKSGDDKISSPGKITVTDSDEVFFFKNNNKELEIWNSIFAICSKCNIYVVTTDKRIEYRVLGDTVAESLFATAKMHPCQLDTFITADENNAVMLCDDNFLRSLLHVSGIAHTNISALLYTLDSQEEMEKVALRLSETNYIYTPIICHDEETMNKLWNNLMTGERKKKAYTRMILQYRYWKTQLNNRDE